MHFAIVFTKKIGAKKVAVLFWIIDSIIPAAIVQKVRSKNKLFAKCLIVSALANLVMSIGAYSYYIGYSRQAFWAIGWGITRNGIYFSVISMISAVLITVYFCTKNWDRGRTRSYRNNKEFGSFLMKTDKVLLDKLLLIIAVLVSLAVRLIGFWWGNGVTFHPDEGNMVREPMRMAQEGSLMSQAVFYPAQVSHKILSICFKGYEIICSIFDIEFSTVWCYYIGRIYIALLSAGIVVCIFFIGNYLKRHAGTVASCMAAVFPPFVQTAHCITGDTVTALLGCLAMLAAFAYLRGTKRLQWLFAMSFLAAAATLEKWNGMVICGLIAVVVIVNYCAECEMHIKRLRFLEIVKEGFFAIGSVLLSLVLISPNLLGLLPVIAESVNHVVGGYAGNNTFGDNVYEYCMEFLSHAGILCVPLLAVGLWAMRTCRKKDLSVLSMGLLSMIGMCLQNRAFIRWGYSFYICFIIIIGLGITEFWTSRYMRQNTIAKAVFTAVIVLIGVNQIAETIFLDVIYTNSQRDTRLAAEEWCRQQGIQIEDCIYDDYTCWAPGGISRYPVEWNKIGIGRWASAEDNAVRILSLGRKYAVLNKTQYPQNFEYVEGGNKELSLEPEIPQEGFLYDFYHAYSPKIYEGYSIFDSVKKSLAILQEKAWIGYNIEIYDISSFPASEVFARDDMDLSVTEDGKVVYTGWITNIPQGNYEILLSQPSASQSMFRLEDERGDRIEQMPLVNGKAVMELDAQHYYVQCKVIFDEDNTFEQLTISAVK